jgi:hypothetical protein
MSSLSESNDSSSSNHYSSNTNHFTSISSNEKILGDMDEDDMAIT